MAIPDPISKLRQAILRDYAVSVGLDPQARYYGGARLRPVVPLDTGVRGVFILGAYPSTRFETVQGETDVPIADNLGPFEPERYFDGSRVRTQKSADELQQLYLTPLGIRRRDCWITDLVKVFLFKPGHREKYARLGCAPPTGYERESFELLALKSIGWIERELAIARPRVVITLGAELAGLLRGVQGFDQRAALIGASLTPLRFGSCVVPTVHLAHPGIILRKSNGDQNPWPRRHQEEHMPALKLALASL